jgi:hypothetical protein
MKRSRLSLEGWERDDLLNLLSDINARLIAERDAILQQLPHEVWRLIWMVDRASIFRFACVSRYWSTQCNALIRELYQDEKLFSNRVLLRFPELMKVRLLHFPVQRGNVTGESLSRLTNLTSLKLVDGYDKIKPSDITYPLKLKSLSIPYNMQFNNNALIQMVNLTKLNISDNDMINDFTVKQLTNLTRLNLTSNNQITYSAVKKLKKLTWLDLSRYTNLSNRDLSRCTNLKTLILSHNCFIDDTALSTLTKLTRLEMYYTAITNNGIEKLTNLQSLSFTGNVQITNLGLRHLTRLRHLTVNHLIDNDGIKHLTLMTALVANERITPTVLTNMSFLKELDIRNSKIKRDDVTHLTQITRLLYKK